MTDVDEIDAERYSGPDRYISIAEDFLNVELTAVQRRILRAVGEHQRVLIISGNGVGKSWIAAVLNLAFLIRHPGSTNMATSGTYSVLTDVLWKPMRSMFSETELPGRTLESPPRIELEDEWWFKCVSPRYPGNLEGRHAGALLISVEECDKPDITQEHIDSAESSITSEDDRLLAVANPPEDEANVVSDLMEDDRWHVVQFSSFDSRNVKVDAGETNADRIPGLVDLATIKDDWVNWTGEPWPGLETARTAHLNRDDLDTRWYRRRAGVMPPKGAAEHRPIDVVDVEAASARSVDSPEVAISDAPSALGIDVARSGDRTVMIGVHGDELRVHYAERGSNHTQQETELRRHLDQWPEATVAVDAVGEGSGLGDRLQQAYGDVHRFKAGGTANQSTEFKDCWSEGLHALGSQLSDGGVIDDHRLREELLIAARTITFDERHYASRGRDGATVLEASSKSAVKDQLGRSPDYLDAALMAAWAGSGHATRTQRITRRGTPDELARERKAGTRDTSSSASSESAEAEKATANSPRREVRRRSPLGSSHSRRTQSDRERKREADEESRRYFED